MQSWIHVIEWRATVHPDLAALVAKNSPDFLVHAFAIMRAGATPAFINCRLSVSELADMLTLVQPVALAADGEFTKLFGPIGSDVLGQVVIGGGEVPDGWLDGADLVGPTPPRPRLSVYPAEVEAVLARHPAVAEIAVIGRPDPTWGEAMHAVIRPVDGAEVTGDDIITWCRERLSHFKCPKSVEFTGPLPRTTTGKVLKRELREQGARR